MVKITEIFNSISGEVGHYLQGRLTTFVRFSGCVAACPWCDTKYHTHYKEFTEVNLLQKVWEKYGQTNHLCITGGEPLMHPNAVSALADAFERSWIETSGLVSFRDFIGRVPLVVDFKPEDVMKGGKKKTSSVQEYLDLTERDWIKYVIGSKEHFDCAVANYRFFIQNGCKANYAFAPIHNAVTPKQLYAWMMSAKTHNAVINLQLHKYVGLQ